MATTKGETRKGKIQAQHFLTVEKMIEYLFFLSALFAVICIVMITGFIFYKGTPAIKEIGLLNFVFGKIWRPSGEMYGIYSMIIGSILSTIGAIILGVPIGLLTAIYIAELAKDRVVNILQPAIELLAGIPSVVYGFFGLVVIVPWVSDVFGGAGNSLLATSMILGIMILPTIINISVSSIRAVPKEYKEGSLAMGATTIQTIFKVIVPAAKSGILAAVILGVGRAIGETMAVILVSGNSPLVPQKITDPIRTLTANIALEMKYAYGLQEEALFATGVILFIFIMLLNFILTAFIRRAGE